MPIQLHTISGIKAGTELYSGKNLLKENWYFKNQELHDKFRDLVIKAFALLQEKHKCGMKFDYTTIVEGGLVVGDESLIVFPEGSKCKRKPDISIFIFKNRDGLEQLSEWRATIDCLLRDKTISKQVKGELTTPFGSFGLDALHLLRRVIYMSIEEKKLFLFNSDRFDSVYSELEKYYYSNNVVRTSFSPLLGFNSKINEILLSEGVKIRRILKDEIIYLWNNSIWFRALVEQNNVAFSNSSPLRFLLEVSIKYPKITPNEKVSLQSAEKVSKNILSSLRLYKEGWIACPFIFSRFVSKLPSVTSYGMSGSLPRVPVGPSYEMKKEEVEDFTKFYQEIKGKINYSKIALNRFNQTYNRERLAPQIYEDRIIDYCVAFEALFCKGDTKQKGEIISTGASMLIGRDNHEREEIRNYLRKTYRVRNDIVHASRSISDSLKKRKINDDLGVFIRTVERYLRTCIKKFMTS